MDLAAASQRWVAHPRRSGRNAPVAPAIVERLINDSWSREDLDDGLGTAPDLALVAAQFDHSNALPAEGNSTGSENDLFDVTDAGAIHFGGSVIFSTGCHSGLSVSDILIAPTGAVATDWAQTILGRGAAAYLGYTGYGHGDDTAVALSEALMVSFACGLEEYATVGEALLYAKQDYAADLTVYGAFDEKALVQATLYGIPFFRLGNSRVDEPVPDPTTAPASTGAQSFTGTFDPELIAATDGTDEYWYTPDAEGGEQLQVTRSPDPAPLRVGGDPAGPATARAVYDLAAHEDNADAGSVTFALEPAITTYLSPEGPRQKVTMAVGALEATGPDGTGTMRLYEGFEATRYYAVDPDGRRSPACLPWWPRRPGRARRRRGSASNSGRRVGGALDTSSAPVLGNISGPVGPVQPGSSTSLSVDVTDYDGSADSWSLTWDFGDGTSCVVESVGFDFGIGSGADAQMSFGGRCCRRRVRRSCR
ncbi:MAG: PKD domain-containing protein [Acidimicrobiia bacterium]|nr:PKD domain-containing protein [Acidimicrobiia bacterium]